jgi:3'(2'), 5'-bisphosphate nucleotidase
MVIPKWSGGLMAAAVRVPAHACTLEAEVFNLPEHSLLAPMVTAAIDAGRAIIEIYSRGFEVQRKEDASPVTEADHAAEAIILERLARIAPGVPVVAEEEVSAGRIPAVGNRFFLVDPLDGTREFVARRGDFTVNIALVENGEPVLGVVYAPANSKLFAGDVANGIAFRSAQRTDSADLAPREPIRVRPIPAQGVTAVASRSHRTPETDAFLLRAKVKDLVSIGSSLKFGLVAAGEADLYPRLGTTMEWDTAAGHAVLAAAGGKVTTLDGTPLHYGKPDFRNPSFVASSGQ